MKLIKFFEKKYFYSIFEWILIGCLISALALSISGCEVNAKDKIAPKLIKTNLSENKTMSTAASIVLIFSEALDKKYIKNNVFLKDAKGEKIPQDKYFIHYDNINKISIGLLDKKLLATNANYEIEVGTLQDLTGNKLANPTSIRFKLIDDIRPKLLGYDLHYGYKHKASEPLIFEFTEELDPKSLDFISITNNFKNIKLNKNQYSIKFDPDNRNKIVVELKDKNLINTTNNLILTFGSLFPKDKNKDIKDLNGNRLEMKPYRHKNFYFLESLKPYIIKTNLNANDQLNSKNTLELVFNEKLNPNYINQDTIILKNGADIINKNKYKIIYDNNNVKKPTSIFINFLDNDLKNSNKTYTLEFNGLRDVSGNNWNPDKDTIGNTTEQAPLTIKFIDTLAPKFASSNIFNGYLLEDANTIAIKFNEPITDASKNEVTLNQGSSPITTTNSLSEDKKTIFIKPITNLTKGISYNLSLTSAISDLSGNKLAQTQKINFQLLAKDKVVFVKADANANANGASWAEAKSLKTALSEFNTSIANNKKIFLLAGGIYKTPDAQTYFELKDEMQIYGGFDPNNMQKARDLTTTIIDGNFDEAQKLTSQQLFVGKNLSNASVLDGLVLQNAKNTQRTNKGGAIYLQNSSPKLLNLTFNNNVSMGEKTNYLNKYGVYTGFIQYIYDGLSGGGALNLDNSSPLIQNSNFNKNTSFNYGGAIASYNNSAPEIIDCFFGENTTYAMGGAIYFENSTASIDNTIFYRNNFSDRFESIQSKKTQLVKISANMGVGGAISNQKSTTKIKNSIFIENQTILYKSEHHKSAGGAIYNSDSDILLQACSFKRNKSITGGAVFNVDSNPKIINSSFLVNSVYMQNSTYDNISKGGAIFNSSSNPLIINSSFVNNTAGIGGAFYNETKSKPKIYNSILWNNGGFIDYKFGKHFIQNDRVQIVYITNKNTINNIFSDKSSSAELKNSILNPLSLQEQGLRIAPEISNSTQDPLLSPFDYKDNFVAPQKVTSKVNPAINTGSNELYLEALKAIDPNFTSNAIPIDAKDQAGNLRSQGAKIDIGAVEIE